jgi:ABC-type antimicrobial peptide transport system permease subunit
MVLGYGLRLTAAGIALGLVGAFAFTRLVSGLLYDVAPSDPATLAGGALLLAAVALVACYAPGRRAARIDPLAALRSE